VSALPGPVVLLEGDSSACLGRVLLFAQRVLLLENDLLARLGCALLLDAAAL
jgi:hypothetical protein